MHLELVIPTKPVSSTADNCFRSLRLDRSSALLGAGHKNLKMPFAGNDGPDRRIDPATPHPCLWPAPIPS